MKKKTALVTGASKGIGLATSKLLIQEGWKVIGIARSAPDLSSENFVFYSQDLSALNKLPNFFSELLETHKTFDALICNAGQGRFGSLEEISFSQAKSLLEINFLSHLYCIKSLLPSMKHRKEGKILLIGSEAALEGKKRGSVYCASKFALRGFSKALREECSTSGIQVSLINPGMVKTDFFSSLDFCHGSEEEHYLTACDVAKTLVFLLQARTGTVFDEINLSPQKKMLVKKTKDSVISELLSPEINKLN